MKQTLSCNKYKQFDYHACWTVDDDLRLVKHFFFLFIHVMRIFLTGGRERLQAKREGLHAKRSGVSTCIPLYYKWNHFLRPSVITTTEHYTVRILLCFCHVVEILIVPIQTSSSKLNHNGSAAVTGVGVVSAQQGRLPTNNSTVYTLSTSTRTQVKIARMRYS